MALLQKYHAGETDPNAEPPALVALELAEITKAIEMEKAAQQTSWSSLVATPGKSTPRNCWPITRVWTSRRCVVIRH